MERTQPAPQLQSLNDPNPFVCSRYGGTVHTLLATSLRFQTRCSHADDSSRLSYMTSQYYALWSAGLRPNRIFVGSINNSCSSSSSPALHAAGLHNILYAQRHNIINCFNLLVFCTIKLVRVVYSERKIFSATICVTSVKLGLREVHEPPIWCVNLNYAYRTSHISIY